MMVEVENPDGSTTVWFGVSDFDAAANGQIRLWFHRDVDAGNSQFRDIEGAVTRAVSEAGYDEEGAYETIGDLAISDETSVFVGVRPPSSPPRPAAEAPEV
jgi:hypothetical protein